MESGDTPPGRGNALSTLPRAATACPATVLARPFTAKNMGAVGALLALRIRKRTVARECSETVWRELAALEYGKSLRWHRTLTGPHRAYGTNRPEIVSETGVTVPTDDLSVLDWFSKTIGYILDKMESAKAESRALANQWDALLPKLVPGGVEVGEPGTQLKASLRQ